MENAAEVEPTDAELTQKLEQARQRANLFSAGSSPTGSPTPTERVVSCPTCQKLREVEHPNELPQRFFSAASNFGIWLPRSCKDCNDAIAAREALATRRKEAELLDKRLRESGLPRAYATGKRGTADLAKGPNTPGFADARRQCVNLLAGQTSTPWLWLWSPETGTYKTTLLCCTLLQAIKQGVSARFVNVPEFFESVRRTYSTDSIETETDVIDPLRQTRWLGLDEIAGETPTRHNAEVMYRIINRRFEVDADAEPGKRGVIFASNCSISQFVAGYAEALDSEKNALRLERRIAEMATEIRVTA